MKMDVLWPNEQATEWIHAECQGKQRRCKIDVCRNNMKTQSEMASPYRMTSWDALVMADRRHALSHQANCMAVGNSLKRPTCTIMWIPFVRWHDTLTDDNRSTIHIISIITISFFTPNKTQLTGRLSTDVIYTSPGHAQISTGNSFLKTCNSLHDLLTNKNSITKVMPTTNENQANSLRP